MIKLIQSPRLKIPIVYLIESYNDLKSLPIGIPFIRASITEYDRCVQMMEWEVLWKSCKESKLPFNWEKILREQGYNPWKFGVASSSSGDLFTSDADLGTSEFDEESGDFHKGYSDCDKFLRDISYKVEIDVLKELKLLPTWLDEIELAIKENITNTIVYNPSLYTKKLDLPLGGIEYAPSIKNVIIIDISGSIPRGVSMTMLALAKTLAEQFYADIVITGSKSTLYDYDKLDTLNIETIYEENGMDNDQTYFKHLVMEPRKYKTALIFGDEHQPGYPWSNNFNKKTKKISQDDGKVICKWEINDIMSFHTTQHTNIAGYGRWFNTEKITHIDNWVADLNNK